MSIEQKDPQAKAYFDFLPAFVQESIMQSGVNFNDITELRKCAQNLLDAQE